MNPVDRWLRMRLNPWSTSVTMRWHGEMPLWARVWYMTPLLDRFAHEWMWWHGFWMIVVDTEIPPPDGGVHEPRKPRSPRPVADVRLEPSE